MIAQITGIGAYVPPEIISNADMEMLVDTSDEWIVKRTGIKERRKSNGENTVDMAEKAARHLQLRHKKEFKDVDMIIFASSTVEHTIPSAASQIQTRLGIRQAGSFDLVAACAGFVYALNLSQSLIASGQNRKILILTSEVLTRHTDYNDRTTCILFGDAATACLVEAGSSGTNYKPISGTEGQQGHSLYLSQQASELNGTEIKNHNRIVQDGRKVYKWAVERMSSEFTELLQTNNVTVDEIDFFVPHSANMRIIEGICANTGIDPAKCLQSVELYGNTSANTIPLAIDQAVKSDRLNRGDKIVLLGFGGGLTYSGTIIDWHLEKSGCRS